MNGNPYTFVVSLPTNLIFNWLKLDSEDEKSIELNMSLRFPPKVEGLILTITGTKVTDAEGYC